MRSIRDLLGMGLVTIGWKRSMLMVSPTARSFSNLFVGIQPDASTPRPEEVSNTFAAHVLANQDDTDTTIEQMVDKILIQRRNAGNGTVTTLSGGRLIDLGACWFLSKKVTDNPAFAKKKPERLTPVFGNQFLEAGDYMRIHHNPRRFPSVYEYDWSKRLDDDSENTGVIVDEDRDNGWIVLSKPSGVSVHPTVDNSKENVAACLRRARMNELSTDEQYVATPQRLDQNTSGLLVVASSKLFAAYFSELLRSKTAKQLHGDIETDDSEGGVKKLYRCLVCLKRPQNENDSITWSMSEAACALDAHAINGQVIRHYLEPSTRSPKRFVTESQEGWPECLMKIRKTSSLFDLSESNASTRLAQGLWNASENQPPSCEGVMEVEVELLTGRTHQIRGQLAAMGFPLVGDAQYGGAYARSPKEIIENNYNTSKNSNLLALQCHELSFLEPKIVPHGMKGDTSMVCTDQWLRFKLGKAWWSPHLETYSRVIGNSILPRSARTTSSESLVMKDDRKLPRADLLPPRVSLAPGKNKYVLVQATHPIEDDEWFVKSASPSECGGCHHGNVAQELQEWIKAAGFTANVTGGGRIDFCDGKAHVYGYSYAFGKGDHEKAAAIISEWNQGTTLASFDNSDILY